eukprot:COSAG01_NODE_1708_length_9425_cov_5.499893_10_plen_63_part_00
MSGVWGPGGRHGKMYPRIFPCTKGASTSEALSVLGPQQQAGSSRLQAAARSSYAALTYSRSP